MPHVKIEPSGCCERKGQIQIRFSMYLEPEDYGYEKHHLQVPIVPQEELLSRLDSIKSDVDRLKFEAWISSLPKIWEDTPFHNHFICAEPEDSDKEIMDIGEAFLHEAYIKWCQDEKRDLTNDALPFRRPLSYDEKHKQKCESRVRSMCSQSLERRIT